MKTVLDNQYLQKKTNISSNDNSIVRLHHLRGIIWLKPTLPVFSHLYVAKSLLYVETDANLRSKCAFNSFFDNRWH